MTLSQLTLRAQQQAVEKVSITPAMAKAWLAQGDPNRVLKPSDIAKIANDIRCGAWQYNGQPIIFSGKRLIDGQHRLHAIVLTGIPVVSLIVRDVEPEAMSVIDSGVARTADMTQAPPAERLAYKVRELPALLGIGLARSYRIAKEIGFWNGPRLVVPAAALRRWLKKNPGRR